MQTETLEGYVVDIACLRRYPRRELLERASKHSTKCATMGHCIESGYGLVSKDGSLMLLDSKATPLVLDAIRKLDHPGIILRVIREMREGDMETSRVEIVE